MTIAVTIAETFAVGLAATFVVALLARLGGSMPNWRNMLAIAIGMTIAKAIQLQWSVSGIAYSVALGASVGLCVLVAQSFGTSSPGAMADRTKRPE